ncbi:MAG: 3-hydroxylacyl-ACP dehydratase [Pseudomonadota bacterium]
MLKAAETLDAAGICGRLPHAGQVCQLERVLSCDTHSIACETRAHQRQDNPLRHNGRLGPLVGVEMAGQAMALHLSLQAGAEGAGKGMITRATGLRWQEERLDDLPTALLVRVECEAGVGEMARYRFAIEHAGTTVVEGSLSVLIDAN